MNKAKGFSLIELLIVVAIILIIAAIAIPNLVRARISANEASAANSIRKISTAEVAYTAAFPTVGFAPSLAELGGPSTNCTPSQTTACILDSVLTSGNKSGYTFVAAGFTQGNPTNVAFVTGSAPASFGVSGIRNFCMISDGVLRILTPASSTPAPSAINTCTAYPTAQ